MSRLAIIAAMLALATPAHAFIDLGFVDGYQARIKQFSDPAQAVDYWYASFAPIEGTSFKHIFSGTTYWLTLASDLGLALDTPPAPYDHHPTPGVPEPTTWAMLLMGFVGLGLAFKQRRRVA